jgi:hypothetical protein
MLPLPHILLNYKGMAREAECQTEFGIECQTAFDIPRKPGFFVLFQRLPPPSVTICPDSRTAR